MYVTFSEIAFKPSQKFHKVRVINSGSIGLFQGLAKQPVREKQENCPKKKTSLFNQIRACLLPSWNFYECLS